jgi:homoserine kinase
MPDRVVVRVPATVANLGPGFDCLGLALDWHNEVTVERADVLEITAVGAGADQIPRDATNLVARGAARAMGDEPVRIHQRMAIPYGRGFGSSAAAIVAGLVAGVALTDGRTVERDLLDAAVTFEGHADNVGPCLLGGFTVAAAGTVVRVDVAADVRVLTCVAPTSFGTREARAAVPEQVARGDAVLNLARASMLTAALTAARVDLLLAATDDRIHQPARLALMPESKAVLDALRAGGIAAFLSGAGPSVSAIVPAPEADAALLVARATVPEGWTADVHPIDVSGARVVDAL